ncbi:MAG: zinc-ribbon domain-containing protein [Candidatus Methanoperedens sp.]|nr:zinc-ribbon domain-containing protein [Candidatus Methanoperedens sp.]MCZ7404510.1 zinc-ribbon domain-containing protein [Candidatus Methanoperedens sp.]
MDTKKNMTKQISLSARALAIGVVAALVLVGTVGVIQAGSQSYDFIDNIDKANVYDDNGHQYKYTASSDAISKALSGWWINGEKGWLSDDTGATLFVAGNPTWDTSKRVIVTHPFQTTGSVTGEWSFSPLQYTTLTGYFANGHEGSGCGNGVHYKIEFEDSAGIKKTLLDSVVTDYRNWHSISVDISSFIGQNVKIRFIVDTRGDQGCDQSVWGDIKLTGYAGGTTSTKSDPSLMAEYHFDGDAKDSSGNGNDGTIYGAAFVDGISGKALSFNGVNNYVTAQITDSFNSIKSQGTITEWINFKEDYLNSEAGASCSYGSRALMLWRFGTYAIKSSASIDCADRILSDWRFGESDSQKGSIISQKLESGRWYHVALSYDNNYVILYLNGQKVNSSSLSGELKDSDDKFWIGRNGQAGQPMYYHGLIDEIRIYNRALSAEEIKANYDSIIGKSPSTTATKSAAAPTSSPATPAPTAAPESSNSYVYAGIGGLVLILVAIVALKRRSSSKVEEPLKREPTVKPEPQRPAPLADSPKSKPAPMTMPEAPGVYVKTAFGYKGAAIIYKLKIENNTSDPISDIKVYPYVPDVFLLRDKEKSIALIEPKSSQTVTFEIRPTGECGDCNVSGRVNYYNTASRKRQDIEFEQKSLSIVCPMLHGKEIGEAEWHEAVSNLVKTEENTREIDMPAESLFTMVSRIIKDMHMYMQKPEMTQNQKLFNGVARFYGEGVKGLKYAAQVEVVGGAKKSKLILKAWAEKEDALTGFYHGILDEIEKRVNVKEYIDDSIVQYNVHIGDKIGTLVKDSFVQRSTIGASVRKCPNCGREVEANEKFCLECGAKL